MSRHDIPSLGRFLCSISTVLKKKLNLVFYLFGHHKSQPLDLAQLVEHTTVTVRTHTHVRVAHCMVAGSIPAVEMSLLVRALAATRVPTLWCLRFQFSTDCTLQFPATLGVRLKSPTKNANLRQLLREICSRKFTATNTDTHQNPKILGYLKIGKFEGNLVAQTLHYIAQAQHTPEPRKFPSEGTVDNIICPWSKYFVK